MTANPRSKQAPPPAKESSAISASLPTNAPPAAKSAAPAAADGREPPRAKRQRIVDHLHGVDVQDPYRWLEDMRSPESRAWLKGQDRHARRVLGNLPERAALAKRISELSYLDMLNPPSRRGTRHFFSRQHADREKLVYYWQEGEDGAPRVLIDPNTLSKDGSVAVHDLRVSWDGRWVAYKVSRNASDSATLEVMEVASGKISKVDRIEGARYADPSWTPESDGFYYTRLPVDPSIPEAELPGYAAVYFHRLGGDPKKDRLVRERTGDPKTAIAAELSRDGRFLFFYIQHGWNSTDLYYQDLRPDDGAAGKTQPSSTPTRWQFKHFFTGQKAIASAVAWKGHIYVLTNWGAPRYRIFKVDPRKIAREHWREIIAEHKTAVLEDFSLVGEHLALQYLEKATSRLEIVTLEGKRVRTVSFPGLGSASGLSGNPEDDTAYFSYSSFTTPWTVYRTSIRRGGRKVYFKLKAPVDPAPYKVEQVRYASSDGTQVTMFIVRRKAAPLDGSTPFILTGYGGFNVNLTPSFSASRFAWLERGGGLAIPNLRGGGEYGETWHQAGMLKNKQRSFDDFIAAARFLVEKRYTSPERLAIVGGSNGGLLVGAAMTQSPVLPLGGHCLVDLWMWVNPLKKQRSGKQRKKHRLISPLLNSSTPIQSQGAIHGFTR